jgi:hypothetical protein
MADIGRHGSLTKEKEVSLGAKLPRRRRACHGPRGSVRSADPEGLDA